MSVSDQYHFLYFLIDWIKVFISTHFPHFKHKNGAGTHGNAKKCGPGGPTRDHTHHAMAESGCCVHGRALREGDECEAFF